MQIAIFCKYICAHGFDRSPRYIMSIIVTNCQHCDEQQFQTLSCVHYTIFSVVKLDLFIRAMCDHSCSQIDYEGITCFPLILIICHYTRIRIRIRNSLLR